MGPGADKTGLRKERILSSGLNGFVEKNDIIVRLWSVYFHRGRVLDKVVGYQSSWENYCQMERMARRLGEAGQAFRARVEAAYRLTLMGRPEEALEHHRRLDEEMSAQTFTAIVNQNLLYLAIVLRVLGRYEELQSVLDRSTDREPSEEKTYFIWLNSRGHTLWRLGRWEPAIDCFQRVLAWSRAHLKPIHQAMAHNNLGLVYSDMEDLEKAGDHHQAALRIGQGLHDLGAMSTSYLNLGNVMVQRGDHRAGLELWERARAISQQLGDQAMMAMIENNMGEVCYRTGDYHQAIEHYGSSLQMKQDLGLLSYVDSSLEGLAKCYYELREDGGCREQCRFFGRRLLETLAARPERKDNIQELLRTLDEEYPEDIDKGGITG